MDQNNNSRIVTLKDLWEIGIRHAGIMIIGAAAVVVALFAFHKLTFAPRYTSTATLYILKQPAQEDTEHAESNFSLALNVVNDCTYLLKGHAVLDDVIHELSLAVSYKELCEKVSVSNPDGTRILEVSVEADTPQEAKRIVDCLCEIGSERIEDAMGFQQVNLYEYGTLPDESSNVGKPVLYVIAGAAAAILMYFFFLVSFLWDDTIRTDEDVERYLGLSVLGTIPEFKDEKGYPYQDSDGEKSGNTELEGARHD